MKKTGKKIATLILCGMLAAAAFTGCGAENSETASAGTQEADTQAAAEAVAETTVEDTQVAEQTGAVTFTDDLGREVTVDNPQRVISLIASYADIWYLAGGIDKFTFDKDNNPIGVDESIKAYREDKTMAHLFKQKAGYEPSKGGSPTKNPFAKETFNLTEQGKMLKENPAQAKELAAAAGVTI